MDTNSTLFLISLIVFLGYLAEWLFKKTNLPDMLLLIAVGFILGPSVANYIDPGKLGQIAPLFTTFTLLFLMFDGALAIDIRSLAESIGSGISIGFSNFFASALVIGGIFYFLLPGNDIVLALMMGFSLGGISSAFVIPMLKQINPNKKVYSILTLESALTDVLSIVFALTMMELKILNAIDPKSVFSQIASLFFVAAVMGIIAGFIWIFLEDKFIQKDQNYMMTIAYVVLLYFLTEYLGGNGAIAAMCFGIVITNSRILMDVAERLGGRRRRAVTNGKEKNSNTDSETNRAKSTRKIQVVSQRERFFYQEISFFLKTFFFVYIGLLLNVKLKAILIGTGIAAAVLILRNLTSILTKKFEPFDRVLINSLFARGIAPVAILLMARSKSLVIPAFVTDSVYFAITATIVFSSLRVFIYKQQLKAKGSPGQE